MKPAIGRLFTAEDDRPGSPAVALVNHDLWQRLFAGDSGALGRTLELDGVSHVVIGALPAGFDVPYSAQVWVPMQVSFDTLPMAQLAATAHEFVARLKPRVTLQQADAELKALYKSRIG